MFPNTKLHAKNQKNLSRRFLGKQGETDRERDRETETDPNIRVLRTLSLSRRTKNLFEGLPCMDMISTFLKKFPCILGLSGDIQVARR